MHSIEPILDNQEILVLSVFYKSNLSCSLSYIFAGMDLMEV